MKKNAFLTALISSSFVFSQVGINTNNPHGIFNIDGARDNPAAGVPNNSQQLNDINVTAAGNVGIGTITPSQKLDIRTGGTAISPVTGFKLDDGNQYDQFVLTSDATGIGTWKPIALTTIMGHFPSSAGAGHYSFKTDPNWYQTQAYITLPPGKWKVDVVQLLRIDGNLLSSNDYMWIRFSFSDESTSSNPVPTSDFIGTVKYVSGQVSGPTLLDVFKYGLAQGSVLISNSTSSAKTYYLIAGSSTSSLASSASYLTDIGGSGWGENVITAFPITQ